MLADRSRTSIANSETRHGSAGRGVESICLSCNQATNQSTSGLASTPTRSKSTDHAPAGRDTAFDGILTSFTAQQHVSSLTDLVGRVLVPLSGR